MEDDITYDDDDVAYVDPLDIVNEFTIHPPEVDMYPSDFSTNGKYWLKKLCALAERCAMAEEIVRHAWVHSGYPDCGYDKMTAKQRERYDQLVGRTHDDSQSQ